MSDNRGYQMRAPTWVFLGLIMSAPRLHIKLENFSGFFIEHEKQLTLKNGVKGLIRVVFLICFPREETTEDFSFQGLEQPR